MKSQSCGLRLASAVFGLICLGQLLRIILHVEIHVGSHYIHRWMSAVVVVITALLCVWLWLLASQGAPPASKPDTTSPGSP